MAPPRRRVKHFSSSQTSGFGKPTCCWIAMLRCGALWSDGFGAPPPSRWRLPNSTPLYGANPRNEVKISKSQLDAISANSQNLDELEDWCSQHLHSQLLPYPLLLLFLTCLKRSSFVYIIIFILAFKYEIPFNIIWVFFINHIVGRSFFSSHFILTIYIYFTPTL